jgi:hypothetical protein
LRVLLPAQLQPRSRRLLQTIFKEEWLSASEAATQNLIDLAVENALIEVPSAADKAELKCMTAEGEIVVDTSGLTEEEKRTVADACKYYEHAGLLSNLKISEHSIGFVPDKRLSESLQAVKSIAIRKPHLNQ